METCTRTIHGRPLLRPGPDANERILGALGRAAEYYDVELFAFGMASNHYHLIYFAENGLQMARFQGHLNSNLARELGRLHDFREKFWSRRYRAMIVSEEPEAQRERLKYVLGTGTKEQLVERALDWPGPNAARALVQGEPLVGYWFNRTKEWKARRRGEDFQKYDYATRYEIELQPLPGFVQLSPEAYRAMVAEVVTEIEEEAAALRGDRPVLGVERILSGDPSRRPQTTKKSPAPMLFFASRKEIREAQANRYKDFVDEYELAADRLIQAALQGHRLDPSRHFPKGSFPPAVIEELLKTADGFNPGREFPKGSFPRAWPFVGGRLRPAPPIPPTRPLVYRGPDDPTIVWRGEIPTVHVPRSDLDGTTAHSCSGRISSRSPPPARPSTPPSSTKPQGRAPSRSYRERAIPLPVIVLTSTLSCRGGERDPASHRGGLLGQALIHDKTCRPLYESEEPRWRITHVFRPLESWGSPL